MSQQVFDKRRPSRSGFTLVEVLVAVVILSTGIVSVLHAYNASLVALGVARDRLWSTALIKEKLTELEVAVADGDDPTGLSSKGWFEEPREAFRFDVSVEDCELPVGASEKVGGLHEIRVTVWRDGEERTYQVVTHLCARPASTEVLAE